MIAICDIFIIVKHDEEITLRHEQISGSTTFLWYLLYDRTGDMMESHFANLCSKISESEGKIKIWARERGIEL